MTRFERIKKAIYDTDEIDCFIDMLEIWRDYANQTPHDEIVSILNEEYTDDEEQNLQKMLSLISQNDNHSNNNNNH